MFGFFKLKVLLLGAFFATPVVAAWVLHGSENAGIHRERQTALVSEGEPVERVQVEILAEGSAPQWVYVEVGNQAVPEPGMVSLLALTALLAAFRRQR